MAGRGPLSKKLVWTHMGHHKEPVTDENIYIPTDFLGKVHHPLFITSFFVQLELKSNLLQQACSFGLIFRNSPLSEKIHTLPLYWEREWGKKRARKFLQPFQNTNKQNWGRYSLTMVTVS